MILKKKDFLIIKANWDDKASNISLIAEELNIGLDSIVFVDDNPSERLLVKKILPEVEVPDFPDKEYLIPIFIKEITDKYFSAYSLTNEDSQKLQFYEENVLRNELKTSIVDFADYIKNLEIVLDISEVDDFTISRAAQLTQKTNQFNLRTKRYSENDIYEIIRNHGIAFQMNVKDRFGDNGITGLIILRKESSTIIFIDTLLLSCRVLGREIEYEFLRRILFYLKNMNYCLVKSEFIPTSKNGQTNNFYEKLKFKLVEQNSNKKRYELELKNFNYEENNSFKINLL
jgi:FkbH-like protein